MRSGGQGGSFGGGVALRSTFEIMISRPPTSAHGFGEHGLEIATGCTRQTRLWFDDMADAGIRIPPHEARTKSSTSGASVRLRLFLVMRI